MVEERQEKIFDSTGNVYDFQFLQGLSSLDENSFAAIHAYLYLFIIPIKIVSLNYKIISLKKSECSL